MNRKHQDLTQFWDTNINVWITSLTFNILCFVHTQFICVSYESHTNKLFPNTIDPRDYTIITIHVNKWTFLLKLQLYYEKLIPRCFDPYWNIIRKHKNVSKSWILLYFYSNFFNILEVTTSFVCWALRKFKFSVPRIVIQLSQLTHGMEHVRCYYI
jgi:hypothetical protein